jgi:hypothetical protein
VLCIPIGDVEPTAAMAARTDEARLVFAYLDHDPERPAASFEAAADAFEAASRHVERPNDRLRMIALEAQIEQGRGHADRVTTLLDYLREVTPRTVERIEDTPHGPRSVTTPTALAAWVEHLGREAVEESKEGEVPDADDRSMGNINFDAPLPGLGLDPIDPPAPPPAVIDPGRKDEVRDPGR